MIPALFLALPQEPEPPVENTPIDVGQVARAGRVIGLAFTDEELELMLGGVVEHLRAYETLQALPLANAVAPALVFDPLLGGPVPEVWLPATHELPLPGVARPADLAELYFADLATLAALVKTRQVSCTELAELTLDRLETLDGELHFLITPLRVRALDRAAELDAELEAGKWRGPLHGIPWGAKDLLAARGGPTTWGAAPFRDQVIDADAWVVRRLDQAGANLVAKLTLGALAWGDVWFGGKTRNPWNPEQGSSGSSAGPASAVAAGAVPFAIGSETLGSIVSPADRCGTSALRPTFGRVGREGAMALAWSMDKLGPLCRSVRDAALVLDAIQGVDPGDAATVAAPWAAPVGPLAPDAVKGWKVGYDARAFEAALELAHVLDELRALGVELVPFALPDFPVREMVLILDAESATAFDELTRDGRDDQLVRQIEHAWPNRFRLSRLIPAVEYLRANRLRTQLMVALREAMTGLDLVVHPSFDDAMLTATNLTGHPTVVAPAGFREDGTPFSISFTGHLFDEARLLTAARAWQESTSWHHRHPDL